MTSTQDATDADANTVSATGTAGTVSAAGTGRTDYAKQHHDAFRVVSKAHRRERIAGHRELDERSCTNWMTDPHVWYRHPLLRILIPFIITGLDLYMYLEDPLNDAHVPYNVPFQGHALGLMAFWAAPSTSLAFARLGLTLVSWIFAAIVGRQFVVGVLLRRCVRLTCFQGGSEGTLVVVFLLGGCFMFVGALIYNQLVPDDQLDGTSNDIFLIFGAQTEQYRHVNQCWQALSLLVDMLTILTVLDVCLQDEMRYPNFVPSIKAIWIRSFQGWVRVVFAWSCFICGAVPIVWLVFLTGPNQDQISAPVIFGGSDEVTRSICAGVLVFADLLVTVQDWDFPTFEEPLEIQVPTKVLGTFSDKLRITFVAKFLALIPQPSCSCWKRLCRYLPGPEFFQVSIRGKWLQYGPLCVVMFIDLCYSRTQLFYDPSFFGQYADPRDFFIWTITDQETLESSYEGGYLKDNASELISFEGRWNTSTYEVLIPEALTDVKLNSRFVNSGMKYLALWISGSALFSFACCICTADWRRARVLQEIKLEEEKNRARAREVEEKSEAAAISETPKETPEVPPAPQPAEASEVISDFSSNDVAVRLEASLTSPRVLQRRWRRHPKGGIYGPNFNHFPTEVKMDWPPKDRSRLFKLPESKRLLCVSHVWYYPDGIRSKGNKTISTVLCFASAHKHNHMDSLTIQEIRKFWELETEIKAHFKDCEAKLEEEMEWDKTLQHVCK